MSLEQIQQPFIRPKAEGEKKEGRFDGPLDIISANFLHDFNRRNFDLIKRKENGILSQNLSADVFTIILVAEKEKDKEFATKLEKYILDDMSNNGWFLIPDEENDALVKNKARHEMMDDLRERGVSEEEITRFEFEEELAQ
jgi:Fe-S cluster biosynthesis and repair protein YggX